MAIPAWRSSLVSPPAPLTARFPLWDPGTQIVQGVEESGKKKDKISASSVEVQISTEEEEVLPVHLKAQCYYSLRELFGCATTKQHAASVSAGHAFVSETRDRVTVWTCLLQREKAWQPLLSQVEPQKTLTCENYTRTSRSAALEKTKNKLRAEFIISTGKLCDDVDQTRGRLRWWGRVESLDVRDLDPPLQIWLFHSEGTLNVYSTILNWFTFKKKKRKEKMEKTSAPCLASAHSCCVWSKDAGVFSALFMTCAVNVWPLVDNEAHWGEQ